MNEIMNLKTKGKQAYLIFCSITTMLKVLLWIFGEPIVNIAIISLHTFYYKNLI